MGMVDRKWERNGNSSLEEIPVSRVSRLARWTICYFFIAILRDLTVLWLTRELACLYFVADVLSLDLHRILLFYYSGTELYLMLSWFFGSGSSGDGTILNGNWNKNINTREWELTRGNGREWEYWLCSRTPLNCCCHLQNSCRLSTADVLYKLKQYSAF